MKAPKASTAPVSGAALSRWGARVRSVCPKVPRRVRSSGWLILTGVVLLWMARPLPHPPEAVAPAFAASGSALPSMLRVLGALVLVLAAFFGGLWLWRNWQRLSGGRGPEPKLAVLETRSLGQRHTLYVIGYERQRMLVAASPNGVTMLAPLPEDDSVKEPVPVLATPATSGPAFAAVLLRAVGCRS